MRKAMKKAYLAVQLAAKLAKSKQSMGKYRVKILQSAQYSCLHFELELPLRDLGHLN